MSNERDLPERSPDENLNNHVLEGGKPKVKRDSNANRFYLSRVLMFATGALAIALVSEYCENNQPPQPVESTPTPRPQSLNFRPDSIQGVVYRNWNLSRISPPSSPSPDTN